MVPKIEASLRALTATRIAHIVDGRMSHALLKAIAGNEIPGSGSEQAQFGGTSIVLG
jgi:acetylglutamate kinase